MNAGVADCAGPRAAGQSSETSGALREARQMSSSSRTTSTAPTEMKASATLKTANDQTGVWNRI